MKLNIPGKGQGYLSERSLEILLSAEFPGAVAVPSIGTQRSALEIEPVSGGVMPWRVFAAYAVALASTGFLLVMALTGGIHLG